MQQAVIPPSPNWYGSHNADWAPQLGLYAYAAHNTVTVLNTRVLSVRTMLSGHAQRVTAVAFAGSAICDAPSAATGSSDGDAPSAALLPLLVTASAERSLRLWNVATMQRQRVLYKRPAEISALVASSDGATALIGDKAGSLFAWDLLNPTSKPRKLPGCKQPSAVTCLAAAPAYSVACCTGGAAGSSGEVSGGGSSISGLVMAGYSDGSVLLLDWQRDCIVQRLERHAREVHCVRWAAPPEPAVTAAAAAAAAAARAAGKAQAAVVAATAAAGAAAAVAIGQAASGDAAAAISADSSGVPPENAQRQEQQRQEEQQVGQQQAGSSSKLQDKPVSASEAGEAPPPLPPLPAPPPYLQEPPADAESAPPPPTLPTPLEPAPETAEPPLLAAPTSDASSAPAVPHAVPTAVPPAWEVLLSSGGDGALRVYGFSQHSANRSSGSSTHKGAFGADSSSGVGALPLRLLATLRLPKAHSGLTSSQTSRLWLTAAVVPHPLPPMPALPASQVSCSQSAGEQGQGLAAQSSLQQQQQEQHQQQQQHKSQEQQKRDVWLVSTSHGGDLLAWKLSFPPAIAEAVDTGSPAPAPTKMAGRGSDSDSWRRPTVAPSSPAAAAGAASAGVVGPVRVPIHHGRTVFTLHAASLAVMAASATTEAPSAAGGGSGRKEQQTEQALQGGATQPALLQLITTSMDRSVLLAQLPHPAAAAEAAVQDAPQASWRRESAASTAREAAWKVAAVRWRLTGMGGTVYSLSLLVPPAPHVPAVPPTPAVSQLPAVPPALLSSQPAVLQALPAPVVPVLPAVEELPAGWQEGVVPGERQQQPQQQQRQQELQQQAQQQAQAQQQQQQEAQQEAGSAGLAGGEDSEVPPPPPASPLSAGAPVPFQHEEKPSSEFRRPGEQVDQQPSLSAPLGQKQPQLEGQKLDEQQQQGPQQGLLPHPRPQQQQQHQAKGQQHPTPYLLAAGCGDKTIRVLPLPATAAARRAAAGSDQQRPQQLLLWQHVPDKVTTVAWQPLVPAQQHFPSQQSAAERVASRDKAPTQAANQAAAAPPESTIGAPAGAAGGADATDPTPAGVAAAAAVVASAVVAFGCEDGSVGLTLPSRELSLLLPVKHQGSVLDVRWAPPMIPAPAAGPAVQLYSLSADGVLLRWAALPLPLSDLFSSGSCKYSGSTSSSGGGGGGGSWSGSSGGAAAGSWGLVGSKLMQALASPLDVGTHLGALAAAAVAAGAPGVPVESAAWFALAPGQTRQPLTAFAVPPPDRPATAATVSAAAAITVADSLATYGPGHVLAVAARGDAVAVLQTAPAGATAAAAGEPPLRMLWSTGVSPSVGSTGHDDPVSHLCFSCDSQHLAAAAESGLLSIYPWAAEAGMLPPAHGSKSNSPNGDSSTSGSGGAVKLAAAGPADVAGRASIQLGSAVTALAWMTCSTGTATSGCLGSSGGSALDGDGLAPGSGSAGGGSGAAAGGSVLAAALLSGGIQLLEFHPAGDSYPAIYSHGDTGATHSTMGSCSSGGFDGREGSSGGCGSGGAALVPTMLLRGHSAVVRCLTWLPPELPQPKEGAENEADSQGDIVLSPNQQASPHDQQGQEAEPRRPRPALEPLQGRDEEQQQQPQLLEPAELPGRTAQHAEQVAEQRQPQPLPQLGADQQQLPEARPLPPPPQQQRHQQHQPGLFLLSGAEDQSVRLWDIRRQLQAWQERQQAAAVLASAREEGTSQGVAAAASDGVAAAAAVVAPAATVATEDLVVASTTAREPGAAAATAAVPAAAAAEVEEAPAPATEGASGGGATLEPPQGKGSEEGQATNETTEHMQHVQQVHMQRAQEEPPPPPSSLLPESSHQAAVGQGAPLATAAAPAIPAGGGDDAVVATTNGLEGAARERRVGQQAVPPAVPAPAASTVSSKGPAAAPPAAPPAPAPVVGKKKGAASLLGSRPLLPPAPLSTSYQQQQQRAQRACLQMAGRLLLGQGQEQPIGQPPTGEEAAEQLVGAGPPPPDPAAALLLDCAADPLTASLVLSQQAAKLAADASSAASGPSRLALAQRGAAAALMRGDVAAAVQLLLDSDALTADFVSMSAAAGPAAWRAVTLAYAFKLEHQQQEPHLAALHLAAVGEVEAAVQVYRRAGLMREAVALASARLLPGHSLLLDLHAAYAVQLSSEGQHEQAAAHHVAACRWAAAAAALCSRGTATAAVAAAELCRRALRQAVSRMVPQERDKVQVQLEAAEKLLGELAAAEGIDASDLAAQAAAAATAVQVPLVSHVPQPASAAASQDAMLGAAEASGSRQQRQRRRYSAQQLLALGGSLPGDGGSRHTLQGLPDALARHRDDDTSTAIGGASSSASTSSGGRSTRRQYSLQALLELSESVDELGAVAQQDLQQQLPPELLRAPYKHTAG